MGVRQVCGEAVQSLLRGPEFSLRASTATKAAALSVERERFGVFAATKTPEPSKSMGVQRDQLLTLTVIANQSLSISYPPMLITQPAITTAK